MDRYLRDVETPRQAARYAELEQRLETDKAKRVRRTPSVLIGLTAGLVLASGSVAAYDLERLQTPRGTALAWTEAATFGECRGYERLSVPDPAAPAGQDPRSAGQRCADLQAGAKEAQRNALDVVIEPGRVEQRGDRATVVVRVGRRDLERDVQLTLVRKDGGWAVVRDAAACAGVRCA